MNFVAGLMFFLCSPAFASSHGVRSMRWSVALRSVGQNSARVVSQLKVQSAEISGLANVLARTDLMPERV